MATSNVDCVFHGLSGYDCSIRYLKIFCETLACKNVVVKILYQYVIDESTLNNLKISKNYFLITFHVWANIEDINSEIVKF